MITVQDDWIQYEAVPVRRVAVRGGAGCAQRVPVVRARSVPAVPAVRARPAEPRVGTAVAPLRLTRRGRLVLVLVPALLALSGALLAAGSVTAQAAEPHPLPAAQVADR